MHAIRLKGSALCCEGRGGYYSSRYKAAGTLYSNEEAPGAAGRRCPGSSFLWHGKLAIRVLNAEQSPEQSPEFFRALPDIIVPPADACRKIMQLCVSSAIVKLFQKFLLQFHCFLQRDLIQKFRE